MLTAFKEIILPFLVYAAVLITFVLGIFRRADWALFLLTILIPLPNIWYPIQVFPIGKDTMDLLFISAFIGSKLRRSPDPTSAPNSGFVILLMVVSYLAVWNVTISFNFPLPFTTSNPVLADFKNYVLMMAMYFVAYNTLQTKEQVRTMLMVFMGVVLFMVWREFSSFAAGDSFSWSRRANGPFWVCGLNANHFGAFIAHYSVLALGMFAVDKHKLRRKLYLATFLLSLYPLFYSYSRGAYVAVLAAMVLLGALRYRIFIVAVVILMFTWQIVLPESVVDRIQMTEGTGGELEESAAERLVAWDLAKHLFSDNPIFGIGFGGFFYASQGMRLHNVHNFYLQTAAEQGIVGSLLFLMFFGRTMLSGWRLYKTGSDEFMQSLGLGFIACICAVMVTNVFGDRFSQLALGGYLWLLWGTVDRALVLSRNAKAAEAAGGPSPAQPPPAAHAGAVPHAPRPTQRSPERLS